MLFVGGFLHWSQTATETSASLSVEISSYVLLAKLSASPTNEDLGYATRIIRWLTGQQNHYGGFSSTQVTEHGKCSILGQNCLKTKLLKTSPASVDLLLNCKYLVAVL